MVRIFLMSFLLTGKINNKERFKEILSSNANICSHVSSVIESTLGPSGMDKLIINDQNKKIVTNDGATILNNLHFTNPIAKILVEITKSQDFEVGDGTTTVCLLSSELVSISKELIQEGFFPKEISRNFKKAALISVQILEKLSKKPISDNYQAFRRLLMSCCATTLNSKLISGKRHVFSEMITEIALTLGTKFDPNIISVKSILGGSLNDSFFFKGVGIKKPFSYAGFEKQKKKHYYPLILLIDIELEIKAEKINSEVKINSITKYKQFIDAEWSIIYEKLDQITRSRAKVVFSKQSIGDLATQYFSERGISAGGRISTDDMIRISKGTSAKIISSLGIIHLSHIGTCGLVEEKQIGNERFILISGCITESVTIFIRGSNLKVLDETSRCLNDGIMIVNRLMKNQKIVGGAGSVEMKLSSKLRRYAQTLTGKEQTILGKFAKSLEIIPKVLCKNSGIDQLKIISILRKKHSNFDGWDGIDIENGRVFDAMENYIWEPLNVKVNAIQAATEAACSLLSIDSISLE